MSVPIQISLLKMEFDLIFDADFLRSDIRYVREGSQGVESCVIAQSYLSLRNKRPSVLWELVFKYSSALHFRQTSTNPTYAFPKWEYFFSITYSGKLQRRKKYIKVQTEKLLWKYNAWFKSISALPRNISTTPKQQFGIFCCPWTFHESIS